MTEYQYKYITFDKVAGSVNIPDEAIGVTTDYFGDKAVVQFLVPTDTAKE